MHIGELELLGAAAAPMPVASFSVNKQGVITLTTSMAGTLQSTTVLKNTNTVWTAEGPITGNVTITPSSTNAAKYYRITVP
jgi:hypothetical protein